MLNTLKEIILNFQEQKINSGVPRRTEIPAIPNKAAVCIGVRRSGKSTFMFQIIEKLLKQKINIQNILYINFFDDRLYNLKHQDLNIIMEAYFSIFPNKKNSEKIFCFFDEIQMVSNWEPFIARVLRTENCQVYITGSSSSMLSKDIASQMRGRSLSWEMFPFSFREFLDFHNINSEEPFSTKKRLQIQKYFLEFRTKGGFPEILPLEKKLRIKIHQEYFNVMIFRDIAERYNISHPKALTDLAHRLVNNIGSLYSVNSLTGYLKSLGHKIPKAKISQYLEWFEDAYIFFTVKIFDSSLSRVNANPKKIYCIDHGLALSVSSGVMVNSGHFLENIVFIILRRRFEKISYYKTDTGKEIDFIAVDDSGEKILVQVCDSMSQKDTMRREITGLKEGMSEMSLDRGFIVVSEEENLPMEVPAGIEIIPVWRFALRYS